MDLLSVGDSEMLWLNITNVTLGLVVVAAIGLLLSTTLWEVALKWWQRRQLTTRDVADLLAGAGPHAYVDPELGLTMADGGEPEGGKRKETR